MAAGTMSSRVLGLVRDMAFAALFNRTITDAWGVAFKLPNLFRRLLGEGSLSVSFIPIFVEAKVQDPTGVEAKNLVNSFYSFLLLLLSTLTACGILWAEPVVGLLVGKHFYDVPGKFELTVYMAQIMFGFIFFMSTYAFFMGILNALGQFGLPAMAPTLFNVSMIIANFIPKSWQPVEGEALAWGVLVGGFLQMAILWPALKKKNFVPQIRWDFKNQRMWKVWRNMLPGMLGMGLLQITTLVNTYFAASVGEGANTYVYLADRLLELPLSLISVSIGTALLPTLSKYYSQGDRAEMIRVGNHYLRLNLLVALPAAVGLYVLATPIIQLLFERGEFSPHDRIVTAKVVQVYAITLIVSSAVRVLVPNLYAIKNTWYPALVSGVCLVLHLLLAPIFIGFWGLVGLIYSTLVSSVLNLFLIWIGYQLWIGGFEIKKMALLKLKVVPAASLMGIVIHFYIGFEFWNVLPQFWALLIQVTSSVALAILIYSGFCHLLKVSEWNDVQRRVIAKILRRF